MQSKLIDRIAGSPVLKQLGPGLITGAADDDPSGIATYSQAGAQFGFNRLWTVILTYPLMAAIRMVSARLGVVTGQVCVGWRGRLHRCCFVRCCLRGRRNRKELNAPGRRHQRCHALGVLRQKIALAQVLDTRAAHVPATRTRCFAAAESVDRARCQGQSRPRVSRRAHCARLGR